MKDMAMSVWLDKGNTTPPTHPIGIRTALEAAVERDHAYNVDFLTILMELANRVGQDSSVEILEAYIEKIRQNVANTVKQK